MSSYFHNVMSSVLFNSVPNQEQAEYSVASWKHTPTTFDVFFSLALPYRPPKSRLGAYLWRKRMWFEATFALTMLQPWEKLFLMIFLHSLVLLLLTAILLYFPNYYTYAAARTRYYLYGSDANGVVVDALQHVASEWDTATTTRLAARSAEL